MAKLIEIDLRLLGDKKLSRAMDKLPSVSSKAIVKTAFKNSAERIRPRIVRQIQALGLVDTGRMLRGYSTAPIRALPRSRSVIGMTIKDPTRAKLGISPAAPGYFPFALEYGSTKSWRGHPRGMKAYRFIRDAVDSAANQELATMTRDMKRILEKNWAQLNRGITKGI